MLARFALFAAVILVAVGALSGSGMLDRLASMVTPQAAAPTPASARQPVTLTADVSGHYFVDAQVDGRPVRFVVDTGATAVALSAETAKRLGIMPLGAAFTNASRTANGVVAVAPIRLREIRIGGLRVADVDAVVMPEGALSVDLLGMTFLSRLSGIKVSGRQMTLTP
ncbi:aspartyl protease family protein [Kaistia soli DSM 19436]|uniref:Aspartyl protease family protein n=1 Tax=Kaistia soli DSM 19436 TaxID=1122133 RepID=A0A1M5HXG6_9HYPH|nr:TIGR02281 family clan AA aspartic protease [Kaistia soli]SHG20701.1 aspartyl protease family protein [Kaistia soli DSM 19436]